jgi:uncharacterized protein YdaU (DUF1376 family)
MSEFNPQRARAKRPLPIWMDAFVRDTLHLEGDEVGAYFLILGAMWTSRDCSLPNDPRKLSRVCRCSMAKFKSRIGPAILQLLDVSNDIVFSQRLRKEAVFVQMSVTKQFCRRTGQKPAKLLKGLNWGLSTDKSADEPREPPTQQPNNLHKRERERAGESELSPLFGGQEKKRAPTKPKQASVRDRLIEVASPEAVDSYLEFRKGTKAKGTSDRAASLLLKQMVAIRDRGGDVDEALDIAQLQGWHGLHADWYFKIKGQDNGKPNSNNSAGNRRGLAGSTNADEIADRAIRYANDREAKRRTDRDA